MKIKLFVIIFIILFPVHIIFANETICEEKTQLITLSAINCKIDGRSREDRILSIAEIEGNESWQSIEDLEIWIKQKTQLLRNQRELEHVDINYNIEKGEKQKQVILIITIIDSNNIIALPKPEYSSGSGLDLSIRGRDYNFFGLLSPLKINLGYLVDQKALEKGDLLNAGWYAEVITIIPFKIKNTDWKYSIEQNFNYTKDAFFQSSTISGLSCLYKTEIGNFSANLSEGFHYNSSNGVLYQEEYGDYLLGWYFDTNIGGSYSKNILEIPALETNLNFATSLFFNIKTLPDFSFIGEERAGPILIPSISLSLGQINWIDNLREGFSANLGVSTPFNFYYNKLNTILTFETTFHHSFFSWLGFSSNLFATYRYDTPLTTADYYLRGLTDLYSTYGIFLNVDIPFLLSFEPEKLFGWEWAKVLSFDFKLAPFIDMAATHYTEDPAYNIFNPFYFCPGVEAIVYPKAFRSLFLRVSIGFNPKNSKYPSEIYIGLTHQY